MSKEIVCADALEWLSGATDIGAIVTSLPDAEEIGEPIDRWREWFREAVRRCVGAASESAPLVFYQTDRKLAGATFSKAALVVTAAEEVGARLLWHQIALRRDVGAVDLHRPGYTHLLAVSRGARPGTATADVIARGSVLYPNGMGLNAAAFAVRFAAGKEKRTIVDPFCGRGTVPAVAEALGLRAIGVDIDPAQCERARALRLERA